MVSKQHERIINRLFSLGNKGINFLVPISQTSIIKAKLNKSINKERLKCLKCFVLLEATADLSENLISI